MKPNCQTNDSIISAMNQTIGIRTAGKIEKTSRKLLEFEEGRMYLFSMINYH